jgi:hypothetical protein
MCMGKSFPCMHGRDLLDDARGRGKASESNLGDNGKDLNVCRCI